MTQSFYPLLFTPLHNLYSILAALIIAGLIGGYFAKQIYLPSITGNIIAGVLLGPVFGIINITSPFMANQLEPFANLSFSLIAISIGSHLKFRVLHNSIKRIAVIALVQATVLPLFCFVGLYATQLTWGMDRLSYEIPLILSVFSIATAPATVVHVVKECQARGIFVKTLLAVVVLNNVSNLVVFEIVKEALFGSHVTSVLVAVFFKIVGAIFLGVIISALLTFLWKRIFPRKKETTFSFAALIIAFGVATELELSPVLTNLTVGVYLANFSEKNQILDVFEDFEELIFSLFFTLTGAHAVFNHLEWVGMMCLAYIFFRFWGNYFCLYVSGRLTPLPKRVNKYLGMSLLPQGGITVGLVVALEALSLPMGSEFITPVILLAVTLTEIVGPILLRLSLHQSGEAGTQPMGMGAFLQEEFITLSITPHSKEEVIEQLVNFLFKTHSIDSQKKRAFLQEVLDKESRGSTGIGKGIAIPHGYLGSLDKTRAVMAVLSRPVLWDSVDGNPVELVIFLASGKKNSRHHLQVLAAIASFFLKNQALLESLKNCKEASQVYELITEEEVESLHQLVLD